MANAINIPKTHLIMGLSLPLAVLIGYFLAEPMDLGSLAVLAAVLGVLCIPLLMRWYHPLLVVCWNAALTPVFLPGRPGAWAILAFIGLSIAILNRAINRQALFIIVPPVTRSILCLAAVTLATAMLTGGIGSRVFGSSQYGASKYFSLLAGIAGYFALTSRRIPSDRVGLYLALFFLSGMTYAAVNVALLLGPQFVVVANFFSADFAQYQLRDLEGGATVGMVRYGGLGMLASAVYTYLFARFGIRGVFQLNRPWRLLFLILPLAAGLMGGFRSYVMLFGLTFVVLFYVEGLHRTRYLPIGLGLLLLGGAVILPQANHLPLVAQRALSFLPGNFDPAAVMSGSATVEWRVEMWKQVLPEVPKYLFQGKGFAIDPTDLYLAQQASLRFGGEGLAGTIVAGEFHSGPLSILIAFGIYGMLAFVWVLIAGLRVLHRYYKFGNPAYRNINTLLFAAFAGRALFFFIGFGSIHSDIPYFAGLLGFGVALNGADVSPAVQPAVPAVGPALRPALINSPRRNFSAHHV